MALLALAAFLSALQPDGPVKPDHVWAGVLPDETLRALAPASKLINDEQSLARVWDAWRPGEDVPNIDFAKSIVVVGTIDGPNRMFAAITNDAGNLKAQFGGTKIAGPGFGYVLAEVKREGLKSFEGQPLPKSSTKPRPKGDAASKAKGDAPARSPRESIRVSVRGTLETGIIAIGGETTGTVIRAKGMTFEVQLDQSNLRERAEALNGQPAVVAGELVVKEGVETGTRFIIEAQRIDLVPGSRPAKPKANPASEP